ncbi:hypothetical protein ELG69_35350 [Rhizobium leguminosarum]|nr:hypothetical protein ELG90_35440 [Rhizobium leguminosarum]TBF85570.1 hypothetical protein ELG85_37395 [Rhizobium leguminosarum]TBG28684.1 hypothetical protein ELG78_36475 [Rhizobium leguminosarum]TBG52426.1 hypothetical protein ELG74_37630 [Rhizobium leguminosarum]TBG71809.1 hypothetical protein ELG69_35350 [Rhizobium leguminosarum]
MWSPFVLSKQTESQLADFTQLFFGQALKQEILPRWRAEKRNSFTRRDHRCKSKRGSKEPRIVRN